MEYSVLNLLLLFSGISGSSGISGIGDISDSSGISGISDTSGSSGISGSSGKLVTPVPINTEANRASNIEYYISAYDILLAGTRACVWVCVGGCGCLCKCVCV